MNIIRFKTYDGSHVYKNVENASPKRSIFVLTFGLNNKRKWMVYEYGQGTTLTRTPSTFLFISFDFYKYKYKCEYNYKHK